MCCISRDTAPEGAEGRGLETALGTGPGMGRGTGLLVYCTSYWGHIAVPDSSCGKLAGIPTPLSCSHRGLGRDLAAGRIHTAS